MLKCLSDEANFLISNRFIIYRPCFLLAQDFIRWLYLKGPTAAQKACVWFTVDLHFGIFKFREAVIERSACFCCCSDTSKLDYDQNKWSILAYDEL